MVVRVRTLKREIKEGREMTVLSGSAWSSALLVSDLDNGKTLERIRDDQNCLPVR